MNITYMQFVLGAFAEIVDRAMQNVIELEK